MKAGRLIPLILALMISLGITVSAYEDTRNLEQITKSSCEKLMIELVYAIAEHDTDFIDDMSDLMTEQCRNNIKQYAINNDLGSKLGDFVIDFTYPENSSTGDSVIMLNMKVWDEEVEFNQVYLFEFHINSNGDIYGYNVWVY